MKKYTVIVTQTATQETMIDVEAASPEDARVKAKKRIWDAETDVEWTFSKFGSQRYRVKKHDGLFRPHR